MGINLRKLRRFVGKLISRQVDEKIERGRPQSGNAEAARMNMLLRQGGFGASCAKSPRWCTLVSKEDKIAQLAQFSKVGAGRGNKGGESEAARQLGLDRDDVRRAIKVASITPEAQQAAHVVGNYVEQCQNELERARK